MKTIEKEIWNIYGSLVVYAYQVSLIMYISMLWLVGFGSFDVFSTAIENSYLHEVTRWIFLIYFGSFPHFGK